MTVGPVDFVGFHARFRPQSLAVMEVFSGRRWNYAELDHAIGQWARVLRVDYGLAPGDRLAVLSRNRADLLMLQFACARIGAIYAPLNWRLTPVELQVIIEDVDAALLLGDGELAVAGFPGVDIDEAAARARAATPLPGEPIDPDRASLMLFTSGTSGRPKGAMLSERNLAQIGLNTGYFSQVTHESRYLIDSPMFHIIGISTCVRPPLMDGGAVLISDGFDPERTFARIADPELAVTHYFCVPQMSMMLRRQPGYDPALFRRLTGLFTGGGPHPEAEMKLWLDEGIPTINAYGMSEAGSIFSMPIDIDLIRARPASVGFGTPGIGARIVSDDMEDCPPGVAGELLLKGENVFQGYWRRPEQTAASFTPDGWFRTGDVALVDDGFYYVVDRKKDMFISGGENVYPAEIEAAVTGCPGVAEVAVIGVPDARWGEVGHMALVANGSAIDIEVVRTFLATRLARFKLPKHISLVDSLPRTGSGKVRKDVLRAQLEKDRERPA